MPEQTEPTLARLPDLIDTGPGNMATDLAMLRACAPGGAAFRAYGWSEPTISFGLSQRFADVRTLHGEGTGTPRLVRRPTGGGVVDHRGDWTYALALSADLDLARAAPVEIYREIHQCLAGIIRDLGGAAVTLAPCPRLCGAVLAPSTVSVCFEEPVADDVVLAGSGSKVAGAAMKRGREGVLVQGSIRPGSAFGEAGEEIRTVFFQAFAVSLAGRLGLRLRPTKWAEWAELKGTSSATDDPADGRQLFSSDAWTKRR
ncbi:MAG: hypothetical protein JJT96_19535 [Opitutales bacterium]|nr:hypothetical protein [Opitutales bacterium]